MRKPAKYGIALLVSGCLLTVFLPSCNSGACAAFFAGDQVKALIAQLQGRCCLYEANRSKTNPSRICQKKSEPYIPIPWLTYQCASWAAQCLGAMGKEAREAIPALIQALETGPNNYDTGDGPIPTRDDIMLALGKIGDPRAVKPLITALYLPRPVDAWIYAQPSLKPIGPTAAIKALGLLGPVAQEAVPDIIPFLKDSSPSRFRAATKALGQIKELKAIPALLEALNHPTDAALAADALGEFGAQAKPAVPIMIEMIEKSPNMGGSVLVIGAIRKISGKQDYLPPYHQKGNEAWGELFAMLEDHVENIVISIPIKGVIYTDLPNEERLYVKLKHTAANPDFEAGEMWLEKSGKKNSWETFSTFTEMRQLFEKKLTTRLREVTGN